MPDETRVSIEALRRITDILLTHVEDREGPDVVLDKDFYWSIPPERLYDVYQEPSDLTIGQLSEVLGNLESLVDDPSSAISYELVWLGDLLRAIGHKTVG